MPSLPGGPGPCAAARALAAPIPLTTLQGTSPMQNIVLSWRAASALILACALAACGGSDGGGFASPSASSGTTGAQKTETPAQATSSDSAEVRYAP